MRDDCFCCYSLSASVTRHSPRGFRLMVSWRCLWPSSPVPVRLTWQAFWWPVGGRSLRTMGGHRRTSSLPRGEGAWYRMWMGPVRQAGAHLPSIFPHRCRRSRHSLSLSPLWIRPRKWCTGSCWRMVGLPPPLTPSPLTPPSFHSLPLLSSTLNLLPLLPSPPPLSPSHPSTLTHSTSLPSLPHPPPLPAASIHAVTEEVQRRCVSLPPLTSTSSLAPGQACCAHFSEDSCWHRATVEGVAGPDIATVRRETGCSTYHSLPPSISSPPSFPPLPSIPPYLPIYLPPFLRHSLTHSLTHSLPSSLPPTLTPSLHPSFLSLLLLSPPPPSSPPPRSAMWTMATLPLSPSLTLFQRLSWQSSQCLLSVSVYRL